MRIIALLLSLLLLGGVAPACAEEPLAHATLYYQAHASLRITTGEGKVIYIDPSEGDGYAVPADLILVTHGHSDHNRVTLVKNRNDDCQIFTQKEMLVKGEYQTVELGYVTVQAVQAGNNANHSLKSCVGYVLTFSDGVRVYVSGDTSRTDQMAELAAPQLDYAFFCCDGVYNMGIAEAAECAKLVAAKHTIPYHFGSGASMPDQATIDALGVEGLLLLTPGEELVLE